MRRTFVPFNWRTSSRSRPVIPFGRAFVRAESTQTSRIDRITSKLPRRLQKYTNGLRNAPVPHIVSFLILHEITAIVPLFALFGLFHYTDYVPVSYMSEHFGGYVQEGLARFEKYFKRKGWFGFSKDEAAPANVPGEEQPKDAMDRWKSGDDRYKFVVEIALAYAITKALLPIRIIGSVWATPWFARGLMRVKGAFTKKT